MDSSIWNGVNIHNMFCLNCDETLMVYEGYEKGDELGKVIKSEYKDGLEMVYLNFKCSECNHRASIMLQ